MPPIGSDFPQRKSRKKHVNIERSRSRRAHERKRERKRDARRLSLRIQFGESGSVLIKVITTFLRSFLSLVCVQMQLSFHPIGEQKRRVYVPFGKKKTTRKDNTTMMRGVFRGGGRGGVLLPASFLSGGGVKRCSHSLVGGFVGIPMPTAKSWRRGGILVSTFASSSSVESSLGSRSTLSSSSDERRKKSLVIVESPAKAKTIENYLGKDYRVLATRGHVRDLVNKEGSVDFNNNFEMKWSPTVQNAKYMREIYDACKKCDAVVLATDPDREGEAISWHVLEMLKKKKLLSGEDKKATTTTSSSGSSSNKSKSKHVSRVTFTEVTKNAVLEAFGKPREIDLRLVDAYLARRALDYLYGFTLSGVLWRKLPNATSLSAGRVQSAALRLVVERETEVEAFVPKPYWSVQATLGGESSPDRSAFDAKLLSFEGKKISKFTIESDENAAEMVRRIKNTRAWMVKEVTEKETKRSAGPPFTTSTMQQEASKRLGFGASRCMSAAQKLYEGGSFGDGLITYPRTDGTHASKTAVVEMRKVIEGIFSKQHVPDEPRYFRKKQKNAQEAHEAIRPTSAARHPKEVGKRLGEFSDEARLYALIWARSMASQMSSATVEKIALDVHNNESEKKKEIVLRANGHRLTFEGYLAAYNVVSARRGKEDDPEDARVNKDDDGDEKDSNNEDDDDDDEDDSSSAASTSSPGNESWLPKLNQGDSIYVAECSPFRHETAPPPRFSEGTLVKALEERGIGRPSTYASVLRALVVRGYVAKNGAQLVPDSRGILVSAFLASYFSKYVEYDFTATMEDTLDDVANEQKRYTDLLTDFWTPFKIECEEVSTVEVRAVVDALDERLGMHLFGRVDEDAEEGANRKCPSCENGRLGLKPSKQGGFIGCSNYPACSFTAPLRPLKGLGDENSESAQMEAFPKSLGFMPNTNNAKEVVMKMGPYGPYVELVDHTIVVPSAEQVEDESEEEDGSEKKKTKKTKKATQKAEKPRRVGVSNIGKKPEEVTLEDALYFLAFPIHLGEHATEVFVDEEKEINREAHAGEVTLSLGKFGYYVKFGETLASIPAKFMREDLQNDPRNMTLAQAKDLIEKKRRKPDSTRTKGRFASKAAKEKLAKEKAEKKKQKAVKAKTTTKTTTTKKATSKESDDEKKTTTPKKKKPLTAYFQFAKDNRENVKKENPGVSLGEASKKLGAMWKELDATTKSKYETDAKARLEQFKREEENKVAN